MIDVKKYLDLLGCPARDEITRRSGVISAISFTICGSVMAEMSESDLTGRPVFEWVDVKRLTVSSVNPNIEMPIFKLEADHEQPKET